MKTMHILLVEDNEGDILLIREAFEDARMINDLFVVKDGEKAIHYLNKREGFEDVQTPDIILLDINLPRKNGFEVLEYIKENDKLKHIPVIMLTTSSSEKDVYSSYQKHANCFITKPIDVETFLKVITSIEYFWIHLVTLPGER
ncbi:MAG: response regulator [Balneolaceae bacterium]|jgi:CheY-like chemotaxis protein|nr:MAG: response regulator [Balneolaceae bacterium]